MKKIQRPIEFSAKKGCILEHLQRILTYPESPIGDSKLLQKEISNLFDKYDMDR